MNWLADKLTVYIINKKIISSECYEVYQYGMLTGLEMTLCMAICTIIAIHLKSFLEFTVLIAVFFSLRAYVGGIHLKHYPTCLICSCLVITFLLVAAHSWNPDAHVAVSVTFFACTLINWLAPTATKERLNDSEEEAFFNKQRKRILFGIAALDIMFILLKLKVFWSLIMYTMLVVLLSMIFEISKKWMEVKR
jgi:accessory gene regulator